MVILTATKPNDVAPLRGQAGLQYSLVSPHALKQASDDGLWISLEARGTDVKVGITDIAEVQTCAEGDVRVRFVCHDSNGITYNGTVTNGFTTFAPQT